MAFASRVGLSLRNAASHGLSMRRASGAARFFSSVLQHSSSNNATRLRHLGSRSYTQTTPEKPADAAATTESAVEGVSSFSLPESPVEGAAFVSDAAPDLSDAIISNVLPALQYGDFAALGLSSWSPIGLVAWTYEVINVTTGLPWFWTIVAGSTVCRLFCLPFAIRAARASARMRGIQTEMTKVREKIGTAAKTGDPVAQQRATLEMQALYSKAGVKIMRDMIVPAVVQVPVAIGMFFATKRMCELPVAQLKDSGFSLLPDLTVADPTMILPIALCAVVNVQISLGGKDINAKDVPDMGHYMNCFRGLSVLGMFFMHSLPSGLFVAMLTTSILTGVQSVILRKPAVRQALNIPLIPKHEEGRIPPLRDTGRWIVSKIKENLVLAKSNSVPRKRL